MTRQEANFELLNILSKLVVKHPYLRFNQILIDSEVLEMDEVLCNGERENVIKDSFYEESEDTLKRVKKNKFAFNELYN